MKFRYRLSHIDLERIKNEADLFHELKHHHFETYIYSLRTAQISAAISREMNANKDDTLHYFHCGMVHDIGKLGMDPDFLNYPGAYTMEMVREMQKHPEGGAFLLEHIGASDRLVQSCKHHHTNFDGSGYPGGLSYKSIPFESRLTRISDSVDAYMSKRCYKEGGPVNEAFFDLQQFSGTSYDPELLAVFETVHKRVMKACHELGFDHPPQEIYMHCLNEMYETETFYQTFLNQLNKN